MLLVRSFIHQKANEYYVLGTLLGVKVLAISNIVHEVIVLKEQ